MAAPNTTPQVAQPSQLCDYCHQKPKFSNHQFCSKTCAGQAAILCSHCHKKPKFQNFEYCGKNCASQANPGKPRNNPTVNQAAAKANTYPKGNNFNTKPQQQSVFDPLQIAKLVAQHIPQVQAILGTAQSSNNPAPISQPAGASASAASANSAQTATNLPANNPFMNLTNQLVSQAAPGLAAGNGSSVASSNVKSVAQPLDPSTQQATDTFECLIPGCGQPVHVDAQGNQVSDYCSMKHREEAVTLGLASPCIMCLSLPQSDSDYFCSKACREESMNKQYDE